MAYTTIDNSGEYFNVKTYSGNNTAETKSTEFQVDWLWIKCRNNARSHLMYDSSRGFGNDKHLVPNTSVAEDGDVDGGQVDQGERGFIGSISSSGFYTNSGTAGMHLVNATSNTYVAWYWKVNGGNTTTNDASATGVGSIDSVYQVNTDIGISIVTYTGAGGNQTVAHGLGSVPEIIFAKSRSGAGDWTSFHEPIGNTKFLRLNANNAAGTQSTYWQDTDPTSTVFSVGNAGDVNTSSGTHVAYCMKSVQGFSKFGKYIGNGNTDGPFIYTGFKPAWLMIKETGNANEWRLFDNKRNEHNPVTTHFEVDTTGAETDGGTTHNQYNFLSNGFKIRTSNAGNNRDGGQYIYMCFAESPIVSSEGVPNTAR